MGQGVAALPPEVEAEELEEPGGWRRYAVAAGFLAPALFMLLVWIVYPTVKTIQRSLYDADGSRFVGIDNYKAIFQSDFIVKAIENNAIWLAVVPALVTAIGLVFAVLTERVSWAVAFKTVVFMPMAISLFASGVIWRIMDAKDPHTGAVNAVVGAMHDEFSPPGVLADAAPSTGSLTGSPQTGLLLAKPLRPGSVATLGLTAIPPTAVPHGAAQAAAPRAKAGAIAGVVW